MSTEIPNTATRIENDKYVVFKREDCERLVSPVEIDRYALDDAVVIRQQDIFAGPALHAYAASIGVAMTALRGVRPSLRGDDLAMKALDGEIDNLHALSDFFMRMAEEADAKGFKTPDR